MLLFILLSLFVTASSGASRLRMQPIIVVHDVAQCPGKPNLPVFVSDFKIEQRNKSEYYMSGDLVFKENFNNGFKGKKINLFHIIVQYKNSHDY